MEKRSFGVREHRRQRERESVEQRQEGSPIVTKCVRIFHAQPQRVDPARSARGPPMIWAARQNLLSHARCTISHLRECNLSAAL